MTASWSVSLIVGLVTLVGIIVNVLVNIGFRRGDLKREEARVRIERWRDDRMKVYYKVSEAIADVGQIAWDLRDPDSTLTDEHVVTLDSVLNRLLGLAMQVSFVEDTIEPAVRLRRLYTLIRDLRNDFMVARSREESPPLSRDHVEAAASELLQATTEALYALRKDVGIEGRSEP